MVVLNGKHVLQINAGIYALDFFFIILFGGFYCCLGEGQPGHVFRHNWMYI